LLAAEPRRVDEEIFEKGIAVAGLQRLAAHEAVDLGVGVRISLNLNHLVGRSTVRTFEIEWLLHRRLQSHPIKRNACTNAISARDL
jgi:hypothetical protein